MNYEYYDTAWDVPEPDVEHAVKQLCRQHAQMLISGMIAIAVLFGGVFLLFALAMQNIMVFLGFSLVVGILFFRIIRHMQKYLQIQSQDLFVTQGTCQKLYHLHGKKHALFQLEDGTQRDEVVDTSTYASLSEGTLFLYIKTQHLPEQEVNFPQSTIDLFIRRSKSDYQDWRHAANWKLAEGTYRKGLLRLCAEKIVPPVKSSLLMMIPVSCIAALLIFIIRYNPDYVGSLSQIAGLSVFAVPMLILLLTIVGPYWRMFQLVRKPLYYATGRCEKTIADRKKAGLKVVVLENGTCLENPDYSKYVRTGSQIVCVNTAASHKRKLNFFPADIWEDTEQKSVLVFRATDLKLKHKQ